MNMKTIAMTSMLAALAFSAEARARSLTVADKAKVSLENLRDSAVSVKNASDRLRMFATTSGYSDESHSEELMKLRETANKMGRELHALDDEREALQPWEQDAVAKTLPLLKEVVANTQDAINYFDDHKNHLWGDEYTGFAERIWEASMRIEATLSNSLKLAKIHDQEQRLENTSEAGGQR